MDVRVGLYRKLSPEKLMLLNCSVGEDWAWQELRQAGPLEGQVVSLGNTGPYSQTYDFSSSHAWMLELDHKEG